MKNWFEKLPFALVRIGKENKRLKYPILILLTIMVAVCNMCNAVKTLMYPKMRRRIMALILIFCMMLTLIPTTVYAAEATQSAPQSTAILCEHHAEHTSECGYAEGPAGSPCTHEHIEGCYKEVTSCSHAHMADCYPKDSSVSDNAATSSDTEKKDPTQCTHICSAETNCITKELDCIHAKDTHDDTCGYAAGTEGTACGFVCESCNQTAEKPEQSECICPPVDNGEVVHIEGCPLYEELAVPEQTEAVKAVLALINALPTMDELAAQDTEGEGFADYLAKLRLDTAAARAAYNALTDEQKAEFDPAVLARLTELEGVLAAMPVLMSDAIPELDVNSAYQNVKYTLTAGTPNTATISGVMSKTASTGVDNVLSIPAQVKKDGTTYNVTAIGKNAFYDCTKLTAVTIPNSVTSLGINAFQECANLATVTIPNSITTIPSAAFYSCIRLAEIIIPNSVTTIEKNAFYDCTSLATVTIPNSVTTIGTTAFQSCTSLAALTIPASVTTIGTSAFSTIKNGAVVTLEHTTLIGNGIKAGSFNTNPMSYYYILANPAIAKAMDIDYSSQSTYGIFVSKVPSEFTAQNNNLKLIMALEGGGAVYERGYNVLGVKNGTDIQTTYNGNGYPTYLSTDAAPTFVNSRVVWLPGEGAESYVKSGIWVKTNGEFVSDGKYLRVTYTMRNSTEADISNVSLGVAADTMIAANDNADIFPTATGFRLVDPTGSGMQFTLNCKNAPGADNVDTMWYGQYSTLYKNNLFTDLGEKTDLIGNDSVITFSWKNMSIPAGESITRSVVFGVNAAAAPPILPADGSKPIALYLTTEGQKDITVNAKVTDTTGVTDTLWYTINDGAEQTLGETVTANGSEQTIAGNIAASNFADDGIYTVKLWIMNSKGAMSEVITKVLTVTSGTMGGAGLETGEPPVTPAPPAVCTCIAPAMYAYWEDITNASSTFPCTDYAFPATGNALGGSCEVEGHTTTKVEYTYSFVSATSGNTATVATKDDETTLTFPAADTYTMKCVASANGKETSANKTFTLSAPVSAPKITIKINDGVEVGGPTLQVAIGSTSLSSISKLTITKGEVTAADWTWFAGNGVPVLTKLTDFTIESAVTAVANIPNGVQNEPIFPTTITSVTIPQSIEIGKFAFMTCTKLTDATFLNATTIWNGAFYGCTALTTATFPNTTTINGQAFGGCTALTTASFPKAISIGFKAFDGCTALATASFPEAESSETMAFNGCKALTSVDFSATTSIGVGAFNKCTALATASFPAAITIGGSAFSDCTALATASFPAATSIGEDAFKGCTKLATLKLGAGVPTVADGYVFYDCPKTTLTLVEASGNPLTDDTLTKAQAAYDAVTTGGGTTTDGKWYGWKVREAVAADKITITINDTTTAYGGADLQTAVTAAGDASAISKLTITKGEVTAADWTWFAGNGIPVLTKLTDFTIDNAVTTVAAIPNGASGKPIFPTTITTVTIPQATSIGGHAFRGCTALASVSFPQATSIGTSAFQDCTKLTSVSFSAATSIDGNAFRGCTALTTTIFPVATSIGNQAFYGCKSLTSVSFPVAKSIGTSAFNGCEQLAAFTIPSTMMTIGQGVFSAIKSGAVVTLEHTDALPTGITKDSFKASEAAPYYLVVTDNAVAAALGNTYSSDTPYAMIVSAAPVNPSLEKTNDDGTLRVGAATAPLAMGKYDVFGLKDNNEIFTTYNGGGYSSYLCINSSPSQMDSSRTRLPGAGVESYVKDGIWAKVDTEFVSGGKYLRVTYTMRNSTNAAISNVALGVNADVKIGTDDEASIFPTATGFRLVNTKSVSNDPNGSGMQFTLNCKNAPGVDNVNSMWYGTHSSRNLELFKDLADKTALIGTDSGLAFSWQNMTIPANSSITRSVVFGVGEAATPPTLPPTADGKTPIALYLTTEGDKEITVNAKVTDTTGVTDTLWYTINGGAEQQLGETVTADGTEQVISGNIAASNFTADGNYTVKLWIMNSKGAMSEVITKVLTLSSGTMGGDGLETGGAPVEPTPPAVCTCELSVPTFAGAAITIPADQASTTHALTATGSTLSGSCTETGHSSTAVTYSFAEKTDDSNIASITSTTLTVTGAGSVIVTATATVNGKTATKDATFTVTKAVAGDKITIKINDNPTEYGGATLQTAVTVALNGANISTITKLTITAGEVTAADWEWFRGSSTPVLTKLTDFTVAAAVTKVADIPNRTSGRTFPTSIVSVSIPQVIKIGDRAFYDCAALTTASFPAAKIIGMSAFSNCKALQNITALAVISIGEYAFNSCKALTTASFPAAKSIGGYAFYTCDTLTTATFTVATSIGESAFFACKMLETASFPAATSIGDSSFYTCYALTNTSFPAATSIDSSAFTWCTGLKNVIFPAVTSIGEYAFENCGKLTSASFPAATSIEKGAFKACSLLTSTNFPKVTTIGEYALDSCKELKSASFPEAKIIGTGAFRYCTALATLKLGATVPTTVGENAFTNCLKTTLIPVDADGDALTESTIPKLSVIAANYDKVVSPDTGTTTDGLWFGWKVREAVTPPTCTCTLDSLSAPDGGYGETATTFINQSVATAKFPFEFMFNVQGGYPSGNCQVAGHTETITYSYALTSQNPANNVTITSGSAQAPAIINFKTAGNATVKCTASANGKTKNFTAILTVTAKAISPALGGKLEAPLDQDKVDGVFGEGNATLDDTTTPNTIKLEKDITPETPIELETDVKIDLGGNTITGKPGETPITVGDNDKVTIDGSGTIAGGDSTTGNGGNGITGGTGSNITISNDVIVSGGDGTTGGDGINSGGNVTVGGDVTGGNGSSGNGGDGVDTSTGNITIDNGGSATGGSGGSASSGTGGNGGSGTSSGTVTVDNGGSATGGSGGNGGSGTGGTGGNGTTSTGNADIEGSATGGTGGNSTTTGGNGGNGAASGTGSGAGDITVGGTGDATGGNGGAATGGSGTGGTGGNGTETGGRTEIETGGSTTGGAGGSGSATGGNGGNGTDTTGSDTTINGGTTGGNGGNGNGNGSGGDGGDGTHQGSGTVGGNGTATGGDGGNGAGTGNGGTGGAGVGGGASAGASLDDKSGISGRKAIAEVDDSKSGTTVTVPDESKLADAALTATEKNDPAITEVKVVLNVEKKNNQPDKAAIDTVLNQPAVKADTIGAFFDITLGKIITNAGGVQPSVGVANTSEEIEITIAIPSDMRGGSNYVVIRVHNGTGSALATAQSGDNLTFKTDKFSTYAIAYTKAGGTTPPIPPTPPSDGGNNSNSDSGSSGNGGSYTAPVTGIPSNQTNTPTTAETEIKAEVDANGNGVVNLPSDVVEAAVKKAADEAKKAGTAEHGMAVIIHVSTDGKDANSMSVNLPKATQDYIINKQVSQITLVMKNPAISIGLDLAAVIEINRQAQADVNLSATRLTGTAAMSAAAKEAIGARPVFALSATYQNGTKAVSRVGSGKVMVAIPYALSEKENPGSLYAVYADENGKVEYLTKSSYHANSKAVIFAAAHFRTYAVGYKVIAFTDISGHFAKNDIEFVANRGLLSGTGTTIFGPDTSMTRAMFVTALGRQAEIDSTKYKTSSFTDVKADAYYAPYVAWAADMNIVSGTTATTFAPDQPVTRQEMAVIMQNYAKAMKDSVPKTRELVIFADNASIASWAAEAVKSMQMAGVIMGKDSNKFDPTGIATRAEVSAALHRYIELVIDKATAQGLDVNDSGRIVYYENGRLFTGSKTIDGITYHFGADGIYTKLEAVVPDTKKYITHIIISGDTLWDLSRKHKCTVAEIVGLNGIKDPNNVPVGMEIKIPQK